MSEIVEKAPAPSEQVPAEKPKRKIWKIIVPVIIVVVLVASLGGMYLYGDHVLTNTLDESFQTTYVSDTRLTNIELFPPSADCIAEYTIDNPTEASIRLVKVSFDIWVDEKSIGALTATDKPLPAGGSTVLTATLHIGSEAMDIMLDPPYTMKVSGEVVASTNILFLTVTHTYQKTSTQTITS